jgi:hypothetical protein
LRHPIAADQGPQPLARLGIRNRTRGFAHGACFPSCGRLRGSVRLLAPSGKTHRPVATTLG